MANTLTIDSAVSICYRNIIIKKNKFDFLHFQTSAREHNTFVSNVCLPSDLKQQMNTRINNSKAKYTVRRRILHVN